MTACSCVLRWILIALAGAPAIGWAAVFTVVNTNDSGAGSLRQAILDANMTPGFDEIHFNIAGGGVQTIGVTSALPGINDPVLIDGYTQPGSAANTAGIGTNAQIRIEVQRAATFTGGSFIFLVGSGGSTIRGLAVNSFYAAQIAVTAGSADCVVAGNFIGTDATGTIGYPGEPGTRVGLEVGGDRCRIGGTARADRNLVSGLSNTGIHVGGDDVVVQGNLVGTDASGGNAIGVVDGIVIGAAGFGASPSGVVIGGAGGGNVISGNSGNGILVESGENHSILTNLIGLAAFPLATIPNEGAGILVRDGSLSTIGSQVAGNANAIAGNLGPGVLIGGSPSPTPQGWFVVGNAIFGNGGLP
ncbi:MAG TPA: hypothetical protein VKB52_13525, partial [Rhodanobacteraceae bacterium]|nr:hypothetical protein [Rhodanobacteraceae bacterium]